MMAFAQRILNVEMLMMPGRTTTSLKLSSMTSPGASDWHVREKMPVQTAPFLSGSAWTMKPGCVSCDKF